MTNKQVYGVIAVLGVFMLYLVFKPVAVIQAPEIVEESGGAEDVSSVQTEDGAAEGGALQVDESEAVVIQGVFVSLLEEIDRFDKTYKYLLLNDGTEILRIDLRPLIGYSDIDTIEKLGVQRGDTVTISGVMNDGVFSIESIE